MTHVLSLTEEELQKLRVIVLDSDEEQALVFAKSVLKRIEGSMRKGMDTSKGHL